MGDPWLETAAIRRGAQDPGLGARAPHRLEMLSLGSREEDTSRQRARVPKA